MSVQAALLDGDAERNTHARFFKAGVAFISGSCLAFLGVTAVSTYRRTLHSSNAVESASLLDMAAIRGPSMTLLNLPGASPWKELAIAGIESSGQCNRDVSANAFKKVMSTMSTAEVTAVEKAEEVVQKKAEDILKAGVTPPQGFWDPAGFSTYTSEGRLLFFREAEIKHGRICMLATLGIAVGENFHPLLGGDKWSGPASQLFPFVKEVPLSSFWPLAAIQTFALINALEVKTSFPTLYGTAFNGLWFMDKYDGPEAFAAKADRIPGDLGWDPLGLKPKSEEKLRGMQNRELNNGRLAMIAAVGIIGQEIATGKAVFAPLRFPFLD